MPGYNQKSQTGARRPKICYCASQGQPVAAAIRQIGPMRYVERSLVPAPDALTAAPVLALRRDYLRYLALEPVERAQTRPPDRPAPATPEVLEALTRLFQGRCAFCDAPSPHLSVYRFRPPAEALPLDPADPQGFLHYGWLADVWSNLYPICPECRPARANHFPVQGPRAARPSAEDYEAFLRQAAGDWPLPLAECPVLLDPCADADPGQHLALMPAGDLTPLSPRGAATIAQFRLNRADLVARRAAAVVADAGRAGDGVAADLPFAGLLRGLGATRPRRKVRAYRLAPAEVPDWRLASVSIRSFKALESLDLAWPGRAPGGPHPALMVLGENSAGKSSFLEAVALAMLDDAARADLALAPEPLLLDPAQLGAGWQKTRARAEVRLGFATPDGQTGSRILAITPAGFQAEGALPPGLPVFAYGAYRQFRSGARAWRPSRPVRSLFYPDDLLSNPEGWLMSLPASQFDMVVRALRLIIGGGFRILYRDPVAGRCHMVIDRDGVENRTPLAAVSSGFRTILALSCDVMRWLMRAPGFTTLDMARGLVLIDEVEAHLHPRWKITVMEGLRRALPKLTFIVTAHDPLCLRGLRDGEVRVLARSPGAAAGSDLPVMVETLVDLPDVTKLTVEHLLSSDLFALFDTDDPATARGLAELADALTPGAEMAPARRAALLARFQAEVAGALPVGSTEVARIVQEAVADYLHARRAAPVAQRLALREATKARIRLALGAG